MSISTEISRIKAAKESLKSAINAKGGTLTTELLDDYAAAVTALPSGGSDIDLSGVTVSADKLLAGVVAVDGSGSKVTGTIPEVTASKSGNTVTVPAGHHSKKQEFIFEEAPINLSFVTATASAILEGKIGADKDGKPVNGSIKNCEISHSMIEGGEGGFSKSVSITAGYLAEDFTLDYNGAYPNLTATAADILKGKTAIARAEGGLITTITGTMETVTATLADNIVTVPAGYIAEEQILTVPESGEINVLGNNVIVPAGYWKFPRIATVPEAEKPVIVGNFVKIMRGYHVTDYSLTIGTSKAAETITPGTEDRVIPADTYLTGALTIKGDANLKAENIADGVSIFSVQGTHKGGGMDFYKCAAVDTSAKTWTGYKAALADGVYIFAETVTEGLSYSSVTPEVGKVYTADALAEIKNLYDGSDPTMIFYAPLSEATATAETGQQLSANGNVTYQTIDGVPCVSFGYGSYISISPTDTLPTGNADRTLACWAKTNSNSSERYCLIGYGADQRDKAFYMEMRNNTVAVCGAQSASNESYGNKTVDVSKWHHYALVYSSGTVKFYLDGESSGTFNYGYDTNNSQALIGIISDRSTGGGEKQIASARIYSRALTDSEITELANEFSGDNPDSGDKSYAYTVSGAGIAEANGNYWDSGETNGGMSVYTNGTYNIYYEDDPEIWYLGEKGKTGLYNSGSKSVVGSWKVVTSSAAPAPTVTAYAG